MLLEGVRQQDRKLVVLCVIDRKRDGLELLASFFDTLAIDERLVVHVVRNLYWGDDAKLDMFNGSELKKNMEARGGETVDFPDVADRVAESLNRSRLPIHKAMAEFSFMGCASARELREVQSAHRQVYASAIRSGDRSYGLG